MKFLIKFAQIHETFRLQELDSLVAYFQLDISFNRLDYSDDSCFLIIELQCVEDALKLASRAILIKSIYLLWAYDDNYIGLMQQITDLLPQKLPEIQGKSFKFEVSGSGKRIGTQYMLNKIEEFKFMKLNGKIEMKNPQVLFLVLEDYTHKRLSFKQEPKLKMIYFGTLVADCNRDLINKYSLKTRKYLGTTSMDAELSLVMANQALAGPGKLILDPFVGTGSFLCCCSEFGAFTMGSDIDPRQLRGTTKLTPGSGGIQDNINQYKLNHFVLDLLAVDNAHHCWRENDIFDAIVTDPPYGVRAGAKKLGGKKESKYPATIEYEMVDVIRDLTIFAAKFLRVSGRLVYWLPTFVEEFNVCDIPVPSCFKLLSMSEQNFGKWSRILITLEKVKPYVPTDELTIFHDVGHSRFRYKYFNEEEIKHR